MCINVVKKFVTGRAIIGYKSMRHTKIPGVLKSSYKVIYRSRQAGFRSSGHIRIYVIGKTTHSPMPETAGIYLDRSLYTAFVPDGCVLIKVRVPKGATVWQGDGSEIMASRVKVLKEVKPWTGRR